MNSSVSVTVAAYNVRKSKGFVTPIASSNNGAATSSLTSGTSSDVTQYKVYVRILKESYQYLPGKGNFPFRRGMSANADIQIRRVVNALNVPINEVTKVKLADKKDLFE